LNIKCYNNVVTLIFKLIKHMETNIINVGNSKGIIIPSKLLKIFGFENTVNVEAKDGKLIISPNKKAREGWDKMIEDEIIKNGQPKQLLPDFIENEDLSEWTW
jgi:antitoxin MazE